MLLGLPSHLTSLYIAELELTGQVPQEIPDLSQNLLQLKHLFVKFKESVEDVRILESLLTLPSLRLICLNSLKLIKSMITLSHVVKFSWESMEINHGEIKELAAYGAVNLGAFKQLKSLSIDYSFIAKIDDSFLNFIFNSPSLNRFVLKEGQFRSYTDFFDNDFLSCLRSQFYEKNVDIKFYWNLTEGTNLTFNLLNEKKRIDIHFPKETSNYFEPHCCGCHYTGDFIGSVSASSSFDDLWDAFVDSNREIFQNTFIITIENNVFDMEPFKTLSISASNNLQSLNSYSAHFNESRLNFLRSISKFSHIEVKENESYVKLKPMRCGSVVDG